MSLNKQIVRWGVGVPAILVLLGATVVVPILVAGWGKGLLFVAFEWGIPAYCCYWDMKRWEEKCRKAQVLRQANLEAAHRKDYGSRKQVRDRDAEEQGQEERRVA